MLETGKSVAERTASFLGIPPRVRTKNRYAAAVGTILMIGMLALCSGCKSPGSDKPIGSIVEIKAPLGLPPVPIPPDNPPTAETIALGRRLFYDTRLSRDNSVSCASCHNP